MSADRVLVVVAALLAFAAPVRAETPMDLRDATPRQVAVRFETSPPDRPGQLAAVYTEPLPGWLQAGVLPGQVRVTIPGSVIEASWMKRQRLRPGSFSDYVWTFDARSGEVLSASLSGVLIRHLDIGLFGSDVETTFDTEVGTRVTAGFEPGVRRFGQLVFPLCTHAARDCTLVAPVRYDPGTGYVNAVGVIVGRALGVAARTFSPLGEAIFLEREGSTPRADFANAR